MVGLRWGACGIGPARSSCIDFAERNEVTGATLILRGEADAATGDEAVTEIVGDARGLFAGKGERKPLWAPCRLGEGLVGDAGREQSDTAASLASDLDEARRATPG